MSSTSRLRRLPPVCVLVAALQGLRGRLGFQHRHVGRVLVTEDGQRLRVFRHLARREGSEQAGSSPAVFVARFRFRRFSQRLNRLLSLIPVPLIAGYPGFRHKLWMADEATGTWQGVYEWESPEAVKVYRSSLVLALMNRRADATSISYTMLQDTRLDDFVDQRAVH